MPTWKRLQLCEQVLTREPYRGDCIVWLRLAPTSSPQYQVTHGQVTFYNASYLTDFDRTARTRRSAFRVPPMEVLTPPPPETPRRILREGEVEWDDDWNMAYARVVLPGTRFTRQRRRPERLWKDSKRSTTPRRTPGGFLTEQSCSSTANVSRCFHGAQGRHS